MSLRAEGPYWAKHGQYTTWYNDRGRGDRNRTHDVHAHDCTIYPINLVEFDKPERRVRYRYTYTVPELVDGVYQQVTRTSINTAEADAKFSDGQDVEILEYFDYRRQHNFISLKKEGRWWDDDVGPSYANFEVETDEFINLTYMNSVWLNYALSNRNLGGWRVGGTSVNYEYALRYLGKALSHVREREEDEAENIRLAGGAAILADPDWPVALSEWKMKTGVRNITEFQAKRFVKSSIHG
jgi:hypothetical protein